uniref:Uncharacterized protein n=1 Tax=Octopus bimaculoides TaxID=37653 RepID=A0A0L8GXR8_OCTBM
MVLVPDIVSLDETHYFPLLQFMSIQRLMDNELNGGFRAAERRVVSAPNKVG